MVFKPGQSGNPGGKPPQKPFTDTIRMEMIAAANGDDFPVRPRTLRAIARKLLEMACEGDTKSIEIIADRLEGKVAQALVGADGGPLQITVMRFGEGDGLALQLGGPKIIEAVPGEPLPSSKEPTE